MEAEAEGAGRGGAEEHTRRFADAFSSILADESGPSQKKRKKAEQVRPEPAPTASRCQAL